MIRPLCTTTLTVIFSIALASISAIAACGDTWQSAGADTHSGTCPNGQGGLYTTTKHWRIFWTDGHERNDAHATGTGRCWGGYITNTYCYAVFDAPYWSQNTSTQGDWYQRARNRTVNSQSFACEDAVTGPAYTDNNHRHTCQAECTNQEIEQPYDPSGYGELQCGVCQDLQDNDCAYDMDSFDWKCQDCLSPVVIDTAGNGFDLTSAAEGVDFDISGVGNPVRVSWTQGDDAWLALDRNGNGTIDSGKELFGSVTYQASSTERNGFRALAVYDMASSGGNSDGKINSEDSIFASLRLWLDVNHNGVSEQSELHGLPSMDIRRLDLNYHLSNRTDAHGNRFKYRAKVRDSRGAQVGRWAWDVFLTQQAQANKAAIASDVSRLLSTKVSIFSFKKSKCRA